MAYNTHPNNRFIKLIDHIVSDNDNIELSQQEYLDHKNIIEKSKSYASCGNNGVRNDRIFTHRCRSPLCKVCSQIWAYRQTKRLLDQCQSDDHSKFRMLTCIIDRADSFEEAFYKYGLFKKSVNKDLDNKRKFKKRKKINTPAYRKVTFAGSLELDQILEGRFFDLGDEKQKQYLEKFGFAMNDVSPTSYMVTFHAIIYIDDLTEEEVEALFSKSAPIVHLKQLDEKLTVENDAYNIVGYGTKMKMTTTFENGKEEEWSLEDKNDYIKYMFLNTKGRQQFKFFKNQRR